jgi:hypothetical protein
MGNAIDKFVKDYFFVSLILADCIRNPAMDSKIVAKDMRLISCNRESKIKISFAGLIRVVTINKKGFFMWDCSFVENAL